MNITSSTNLSPGVYCGGLKIGGSSTVNLDPGTYIMDSGNFEVAGDVYIYGTGVTIILTSSSNNYGSVKITGGTEIDLSAPTSGDYAGVDIYQDPDAPEGNSNDITGTADMDIEGAVYLPSGDLNIGGNGNYSGQCTQLIADTVTLVGDAEILNNCENMPIRPLGAMRAQLVE